MPEYVPPEWMLLGDKGAMVAISGAIDSYREANRALFDRNPLMRLGVVTFFENNRPNAMLWLAQMTANRDEERIRKAYDKFVGTDHAGGVIFSEPDSDTVEIVEGRVRVGENLFRDPDVRSVASIVRAYACVVQNCEEDFEGTGEQTGRVSMGDVIEGIFLKMVENTRR